MHVQKLMLDRLGQIRTAGFVDKVEGETEVLAAEHLCDVLLVEIDDAAIGRAGEEVLCP